MVTLLLSLVVTWVTSRNSISQGADYATDVFQRDWDQKYVEARHDFEMLLNQTYDTLRTVASLHGVGPADGGVRHTVQQLYNNLASHVPVSRLWITGVDLTPDQVDPVTGRVKGLVDVFDSIVVSDAVIAAPIITDSSANAALGEYRAMNDQLRFFRERFPELAAGQGLDYPALSSPALVTSDSREVGPVGALVAGEVNRKGIVYSVPIYGVDGKLTGLVSAELRTEAMARVFRQPYFVAVRPEPEYAVAAPHLAAELAPALDDIRRGDTPKGFPYARTEVCMVTDCKEWMLTAAVPTSVLQNSPLFRARTRQGTLILVAGVAVSLLSSAVVWTLSSTRLRAVALAVSERRFRTLVHNIPGAVYRCGTDRDRAIQYVSDGIEDIIGKAAATLVPGSLMELIHPEDHSIVRQQLAGAIGEGGGRYLVEYRVSRADGELRWVQDRGQVVADDSGNPPCIDGAILDVTDRKRAESERERMHRELEDASRKAGMAEVASGVLHNVGNVLNSLNVSTTLVTERLQKSKIANLGKAAQMMAEHKDDLPAFLTTDEKGRRLPAYLLDLAGFLAQEHAAVFDEIKAASENVEHIKSIIITQQTYAKNSTFLSPIRPAELFKDAMRMNTDTYARQGLEVQWELDDLPELPLDKHKIIQILVNLLGNARNAIATSSVKRVTLKARQIESPEGVLIRFAVVDTGIGISPENLARLFTHGFTTRTEGHGFGLHSAANAAREMGGSLYASSEGPGQGATFTLDVPIRAADESRHGSSRASFTTSGVTEHPPK